MSVFKSMELRLFENSLSNLFHLECEPWTLFFWMMHSQIKFQYQLGRAHSCLLPAGRNYAELFIIRSGRYLKSIIDIVEWIMISCLQSLGLSETSDKQPLLIWWRGTLTQTQHHYLALYLSLTCCEHLITLIQRDSVKFQFAQYYTGIRQQLFKWILICLYWRHGRHIMLWPIKPIQMLMKK